METRRPSFTPEDVVEVYRMRHATAEFIRGCFPTAMALRAGLTRWERAIRFSVSVPQTTNPAEAWSEGQPGA